MLVRRRDAHHASVAGVCKQWLPLATVRPNASIVAAAGHAIGRSLNAHARRPDACSQGEPAPGRRRSGNDQLLGKILASVGDLRFANQGKVTLERVRAQPPDLILLDVEMPDMSGFQVCEALKADPALADIPVIFVTAHSDASFEVAGFAIGAVDFIAKPVSAPLVQARVQTQLRLKRITDELRRFLLVDALTGVGNRRRFEDVLDREWRRTHRSAEPLSLVLTASTATMPVSAWQACRAASDRCR